MSTTGFTKVSDRFFVGSSSTPPIGGFDDGSEYWTTTDGTIGGTVTNIFKYEEAAGGWVEQPIGSSPTVVNANNDLGYNTGTLQTGFPLVRDTTTTGAFYRHWANYRNANPEFTGTGMLHGLKNSLIVGYWTSAMVLGQGVLASGYQHVAANSFYGAVIGQNHDISAGSRSVYGGFSISSQQGDSAVFGYDHGNTTRLSGSYNLTSGYRQNGSYNYALVTGRLNTLSGSYHGVIGNQHTVANTANSVTGYLHNVRGSYNSVNGYQSSTTSSYNSVNGYRHTTTGYGLGVFGYRNTVGANRSLVSGDLNNVTGSFNLVVGYSHIATNSSNFIAGYNNEISATNYSGTIGRNNQILSGNYNFSAGFSHLIRNTGNMAIGYDHTLTGSNYGACIGRSCRVTVGNDSIMIGRANVSDVGSDNIAVGKSISNNNGNSVMVAGPGQRLGFFNVAPVARQSSVGVNTVAEVVTILRNYGLVT